MSESKPEIKDLGNSRGGHYVSVECRKTEPVVEVQDVTTQTGDFIEFVKERCEELQRISDQCAFGLADDSKNVPELLTLLDTYRKGLAGLLQEKCHYHLIQRDYMKVYHYANELESVATKLSNAESLQYAQSLLSMKFVESNVAEINTLTSTHSDILQQNRQFIQKLTRNELVVVEYTLLRKLFNDHKLCCDFQFCLDLSNRLLETACYLQKREKIIDMLSQAGHLYFLLGKYQLSYDILKKVRPLETEDVRQACVIVCNLSVVELILELQSESLQHAKDSLLLAQRTEDQSYIACCYGNIGLAFEYMGHYKKAIEPYEKCLQIGNNTENYRVISNGLCNLGRAYQGLGDREKAKWYFEEAIKTPRPPKAYWGDTEEFRFSPEYLLAKLILEKNEEEANLDEVGKQLMETMKRCEMLRKRIQDSPMKITFNDTQRKPYQYLQYVLLEQGKKLEALVIAEKGRARDFFDKIEGEFPAQLDSKEVLLDMIKNRGIAVLFISTLDELGKLCLWFISSEGKLLKQWSIPYTECSDIFTKLCVALYKTQGRAEKEFWGASDEEHLLIEKAFELIKPNITENNDDDSTNSPQKISSSTVDITEGTTTNTEKSCPTSTSDDSTEENCTLSDVIDSLSELILKPLQKELEELITKRPTDDMPKLLIIPQGKTFNIPFAALKLNGKPLCNHVTIIEAFSFNSFAYCTTKSEKKATTSDFENALIVGNPTNLKGLPQAEEEAKMVAEFLAARAFVKNQATKEAVMKHLPNAPLIHFACHGETGGKGLALACGNSRSNKDCLLTAKDVESMKLDADLVVLSACHTARGQINSEGVLGLARAFQIAGARSIVAALWAIPDGATADFMQTFYTNLRRGQPIADAIRTTQVAKLESEGFNDVINWGSFIVFGANAKIM